MPLDDPSPHALAPWPPPAATGPWVAAGWYEDPRRHAELRWWDGAGWTDHEHGQRIVPLRNAAIGFIILVCSRLLIEVAIEPLRGGAVPVWLMAAGFYVLLFGAMLAATRRSLWPDRSMWSWLRHQVRAADLGLGVLVWLTAMASAIVTVSVVRAVGLPFRSNGDIVSVYRDRDTALLVVAMVAALVGAPIVEELFFRGLLLRGLASRLPESAAVAIQALVFGLYHLTPSFGRANVGLVIVLTGYGLVFGVWARRTGRLGPTMVGHAVTNAIALTAVLAR